MSKSYSKLTQDLVIVESPAKCKKIESYLGAGYKCIASFGHLRELATLENINDFEPTYTEIEEPLKKKQIKLIGSEIAAIGGEVILATDDDREGEAIAWHICMLFNLNPAKTKRIIFHEITENAIQESIKHPTTINMNIVNAQKTRQILDMIVGYKISPILWKHISGSSLSAGRCQTPALKLVYENYLEIQKSPGVAQYNTVGYFTSLAIPFELGAHHKTEDEMTDFLFASSEFSHELTCTGPKKVQRAPPLPLNTSRIQQMASNELHYSPKDTMRICQSLYEGGYITYMRTDSKCLSDDFLKEAAKYIKSKWSPNHVGTEEKKKTDKEPHEAIRPTNVNLHELPEKETDSKARRMYKMIWQTTLESCMSPASFYSIKAEVSAPMSLKYGYTAELMEFAGWLAVSNKKEDESKVKIYNTLFSRCKDKIGVKYTKIASTLTMKELKQHYTEARLVQLLEEKGIGRPSTFSSLVEKIQEREYVKKCDVKGREIECKDFELEGDDVSEILKKREFGNEKSKLVIQPLGIIVVEFLEKHFSSLFQYDYTRNMEDALDKISSGLESESESWKDLCKSCLNQVNESIENVKEHKKLEFKIDDEHSYIIGKYGPVIKCIGKGKGKGQNISFKPLRTDIEVDLKKLERGEYNLEDLIEKKVWVKEQRKSDWLYDGMPLEIKKGKFGLYASWGKNTKSLKSLGNRPIENITFEQVVALL